MPEYSRTYFECTVCGYSWVQFYETDASSCVVCGSGDLEKEVLFP